MWKVNHVFNFAVAVKMTFDPLWMRDKSQGTLCKRAGKVKVEEPALDIDLTIAVPLK